MTGNSIRSAIDEFYVVSDPNATRPIRLWLEDEEQISIANGLSRGEVIVDRPIALKGRMGKHASPVLWGSHGGILAINEEVLSLLMLNRFSGWRTYEVSISDADGKLLTGYHGLAITGRCGELIVKGDPVIRGPQYENGPTEEVYVGMGFDPSEWDGSDILMFSRRRLRVFRCTVMNALVDAGISNIKFTPFSEVEIPPRRL